MIKSVFLNSKGQTLIGVMLVMIIALAMGITISQRILSGYIRTTNIDSSARAESVAKAAAEKVLAYSTTALDSYITNNNCGSNCTLSIVGADGVTASAVVTLSFAGNSASAQTSLISKDSTYEINMVGYSDSQQLELCWDNAVTGNNPSIYVSYIFGTNPYQISKYAYNSASTQYSTNGFDSSSPDLSYANCVNLPAKTAPQFARVRAVYNDVNLHVIPKGGATLPIQGYLITSVGTVGTIKRTVTVIKSKPYLPTVFDFAIFSSSDSSPLQN